MPFYGVEEFEALCGMASLGADLPDFTSGPGGANATLLDDDGPALVPLSRSNPALQAKFEAEYAAHAAQVQGSRSPSFEASADASAQLGPIPKFFMSESAADIIDTAHAQAGNEYVPSGRRMTYTPPDFAASFSPETQVLVEVAHGSGGSQTLFPRNTPAARAAANRAASAGPSSTPSSSSGFPWLTTAAVAAPVAAAAGAYALTRSRRKTPVRGRVNPALYSQQMPVRTDSTMTYAGVGALVLVGLAFLLTRK